MLKLIRSELLKLWMKKSFWGILIVLVAVNVLLLWYTENSRAGAPPPCAYTKLAGEIKALSEDEKIRFIDEKLQMLTAVGVFKEISMIEMEAGEPSEYAAALIAQMKEEHPYLEKYRSVFESKTYLSYTSSLESEAGFITEIHDEISKVSEYPVMLSDIEKQAKKLSRVSIFGGETGDSFSSRNIIKTAEDYEGMSDIRIEYGVSKGFTTATDFPVTDIIAILMMFFLGALLIYNEKDKGLFPLIKSASRGRGTTAAAKMCALLVNMLIITLLLFGANMLYTGLFYGLPDMRHSLQSIPQFLSSTLKINIGQYLLLFLASKFFAYFTVSLLVFLVALLSRHPAVTYLSAGTVLIISFLVYGAIPAISNLNVFKYINLISFIRTNGLYQEYLNLNLFGNPVNLIQSIWMALSLVFVILCFVSFLVFCKKKNMQAGEMPFKSLLQKIMLFKYRPSASIFRHEGYKLLVVNKVALLLLVFVLFQWYGNKDAKFYTSYDEPYYQNYMSKLEGKLTPEKQVFLEQEQKKYSDAEESLNAINRLAEKGEMTKEQAETTSSSYQKVLLGKPMFDRIMERSEYIKENPDAEFVYDTGYNQLFGITPNNDNISALMLILICIVCFSALFPMEYKTGAMRLIVGTPLGKSHTNKCKMLVCIVTLIPFFAAVTISDILPVRETLGSLNAPVMSLPAFSHLPSFMPVWGYLSMLYLTRFAACVIVLLGCMAISKMVKNNIFAILISSFIFAVPVILYFMKIRFVYHITMLPLLTVNNIFRGQYSLLLMMVYVIIPICIAFIGTLVNMNVLVKDRL